MSEMSFFFPREYYDESHTGHTHIHTHTHTHTGKYVYLANMYIYHCSYENMLRDYTIPTSGKDTVDDWSCLNKITYHRDKDVRQD